MLYINIRETYLVMKVKLFEKRGRYIHYEIWQGKKKVNSGWYKAWVGLTKGEIAKEIESIYSNIN